MKKTLLFALVGMIAFIGCKKEPLAPNLNPIVNLMADEQPQSVVDSMGTVVFDSPMTSDVTELTDAKILDYPLFLDYDPFTMVVSRCNGGVDSCIRGIEVTKAERELLNRAHLAKLDCQRHNKELIAKIHREIEVLTKTQKENLYKNWYLVEKAKLADSLKMGLLTESQYRDRLYSLELTWKNKMAYLNSQTKEKIKNHLERKGACEKIKDCEKIYLDKVLEILGKTRFKKWIECHKHNYKKK